MRVVIQRVSEASVRVADTAYERSIGAGLLVLCAFEDPDTQDDLEWMAHKICALRIFNDENGVMNISVKDSGGSILIISQFTLFAATARGNRPSYIRAAKPDISIPLYEKFCALVSAELGKDVSTGQFGADMKVSLTNDGPVTICIDSRMRE